MIAAVVVSAILYTDVPPEVVSIRPFRWRAGALSAAANISVVRSEQTVTLSGVDEEGAIVVRFERADATYLLDGPFEWPRENARRAIDPTWRKTLTGTTLVPGPERPAMQVISRSSDASSVWPSCRWISDDRWECAGVPARQPSVVVANRSSEVLVGVATGRDELTLRPCRWGRLVVVNEAAGLPSGLKATPQQAVVSPQRTRGMRLETASIGDVTVTAIDAASVWVCGRASPPQAWLDIRSARGGPVYIPLSDISEGVPSIPVQIDLPETRIASGIVTSSGGAAAGSALVTMFRLIEPRLPDGRSPPAAKRVFVAETVASADGTFEVPGIGDGDYEIAAWHPQFGRAAVSIPSGSAPLTIRLRAPGVARGRVLSGGKPIAGVDVISVPDPSVFQTAEDPLDVKGGDTRTGADGRFSVTLANLGGGELRIGGGTWPVKRIPLPRVVMPLLDLGDIELAVTIDVNVVLDRDPGCTLRAVGPVGRAGLQIVQGDRTGPGIFRLRLPEEGTWAIALLCGNEERGVSPAMLQATRASPGTDVRVIVR